MNKSTLLFVTLFSVGLQALNDTNAKIIRNEVNVCKDDQVVLPCGGTFDSRHRWKVRIPHGPRRGVPNDPSKYIMHNNSSLIVKNVQQADTKKLFYCHTYSSTHHYRVTYIYNLKIICEDADPFIGSKLALHCKVDVPDNDILRIEWKFRSKHHGKAKTISSLAIKGRISMTGRNLTIKDVKVEDCGMFLCLATRKTLGLSKGSYFYNVMVMKTPKTTPTSSQTKLPSTDTATKSVAHTTVQTTASGTIAKTITPITLPEKTTLSKQSTTKLLPLSTTTTKKSSPLNTEIPSSSDGTTTTVPGTKSGKSSLPTWTPASTKVYNPSTNQPTAMTKEAKETLQSEHSTDPSTENPNNEVKRTLSPKHHRKTTRSSNVVDSDNENQQGDEATTMRSSSGTVASRVALVAFLTQALLFFLYKT